MQFRTEVDIAKADFEIQPAERMLFVGSCFADRLGHRFVENRFRATVNPFGVMYNPASILHTVEKSLQVSPRVAVFTLGTNHVYVLKETGEIVDNCQKRPQRLFDERELSVDECADYLQQAVDLLKDARQKSGQSGEDLKVVITVSPIRYAKYGFHGSQLSKATLLLAADRLVRQNPGIVSYFPAYELMNDELRDYRFYADDLVHPSPQAVEYVWEKFSATVLSEQARRLLPDVRHIVVAAAHRPRNPQSATYREFCRRRLEEIAALPQIDFRTEAEYFRRCIEINS